MKLPFTLPRKRASRRVLFLGMACIIGVNLVIILSPRATDPVDQALPVYRSEELRKFDGTDPNKPIYLGYEGKVYDVTAGAAYYAPEGSYHYLAGRDATVELHIAGGGIIKSKYPVIGRLP